MAVRSVAAGAAKKLTPSLEDYLEAVLGLIQAGSVARVRDIARTLGVGMPSVCVALRALAGRGLVNYDPYQVITLTARGHKQAELIHHRHHVLQEFLGEVLGLKPNVAQANACRIEHAIDDYVLDRLLHVVQFVRACPQTRKQLSKAFQHKEWRNEIQAVGESHG
jgi:DtxR family transcriptional regulator, Mn-dependent transcriptional regulator